jgi:excisionase family DNA binding protein
LTNYFIGDKLPAMRMLTTKEAADQLGKGVRAIQALITKGYLPAQKLGRDWLISERDLELVAGIKPGPKPAKKRAVKNA